MENGFCVDLGRRVVYSSASTRVSTGSGARSDRVRRTPESHQRVYLPQTNGAHAMLRTTSRRLYLTSLTLAFSLMLWAAIPAVADGPGTASTTYGQGLSGKLTVAGCSALQPLVDQAAKNYQIANGMCRSVTTRQLERVKT